MSNYHPKGMTKKEYQKRYYRANREMFLEAQLKLVYGITRKDWQQLYDQQNGHCALCDGVGHTGGRKAKLYVDHDHTTGKVRGLVCHRCNLGLGIFGDTKEGLLKAVAYLERPCPI